MDEIQQTGTRHETQKFENRKKMSWYFDIYANISFKDSTHQSGFEINAKISSKDMGIRN